MWNIFLTVQRMIEQGGFSDFHTLAGAAGLQNREVKTICVIDTPNLDGWIFGGEFLLSSGYIFRDNPDQLENVIETASRAGAAGLGIKVGEHIEKVPQGALRAADRMSFPLIGVPAHYAHTEIINPALVTLADNRAKQTSSEEEIRRQFFGILLEESSYESVLGLLHGITRRNLLFLDLATGERQIKSDTPAFAQTIEELPLASLLDHFPHEPIELAGKIQAYLFLDRPAHDAKSEIALAQANNALQLQLKWERERDKLERGRSAQFIQDILYRRFRHDSEMRNRAKVFGWDLSGPQVVIVLDVDENRSVKLAPVEPYPRVFEIFRAMLKEICGNTPCTLLEEGMTFILSAPPEKWPKLRSDLVSLFANARRETRQKTGLQIAMGAGSPVPGILQCDASFREAKRALDIAKRSDNASSPSFWEELGIYKILAPIQDNEDAGAFVRDELGKLLEAGGASGGQDSLLRTLFCVIRHNWQLKPAASALNLHYNTVKYRYRKISEILGTDLESPSARTSLAIAMELHLLGKPERRAVDGK